MNFDCNSTIFSDAVESYQDGEQMKALFTQLFQVFFKDSEKSTRVRDILEDVAKPRNGSWAKLPRHDGHELYVFDQITQLLVSARHEIFPGKHSAERTPFQINCEDVQSLLSWIKDEFITLTEHYDQGERESIQEFVAKTEEAFDLYQKIQTENTQGTNLAYLDEIVDLAKNEPALQQKLTSLVENYTEALKDRIYEIFRAETPENQGIRNAERQGSKKIKPAKEFQEAMTDLQMLLAGEYIDEEDVYAVSCYNLDTTLDWFETYLAENDTPENQGVKDFINQVKDITENYRKKIIDQGAQ